MECLHAGWSSVDQSISGRFAVSPRRFDIAFDTSLPRHRIQRCYSGCGGGGGASIVVVVVAGKWCDWRRRLPRYRTHRGVISEIAWRARLSQPHRRRTQWCTQTKCIRDSSVYVFNVFRVRCLFVCSNKYKRVLICLNNPTGDCNGIGCVLGAIDEFRTKRKRL